MADSKPVLGYWEIRGLGQHIRCLLKYLEVDFEDKLYKFGPAPDHNTDSWYSVKDKLNLPFANLPYLLDGSHKVTESRAIMKHICRTRRPELLGKTPEIQTKVDMADNFIYDIHYCMLIPVVYKYTEEGDKEFKERLGPKLGYLTEFLGDKKWIAGNDIAYVDFYIYEVLHHLVTYDSKCLDKFPKLQSYMKRFEELPAIKAYMASPEYIKAPCFSPTAMIKI